jgi:hypothetical protein
MVYYAVMRKLLLWGLVRTTFAQLNNSSTSGTAKTQQSWECCKPSCGWRGKADVNQPAQSCGLNSMPLTDFDVGTACNGGDAYMCANQSPWAVNDTFSYGFAGAYIAGYLEDNWCCGCYELTFTDELLQGKRMIVQVQNTGYDKAVGTKFILAVGFETS